MTKTIITLNEVKRNNLRSVLDLLLRSDGLSRIEIAARLGCDNTTVSRAVRELIDRGIIGTGSKNGSSSGRPRVALQVSADGPLLLGIAWEADGVTGVLTDLKSSPRRTESIRFSHRPDRQEYLAAVTDVVGRLRRAAPREPAGIGVTVFGSYFGTDAVLEKVAALPMLDGLKLRPFLTDCTGSDVIICDHSVAVAAFLTRMEPALTVGDVMLITVGKGLGVVLLHNGRRIFSRGNHGGEFGHTIRIPGGETCACGRRGCLETLVSTSALLEKYRLLTGEEIALETLGGKFEAGTKTADEVILPATEMLGTAIAEQLNNYPVDKLVVSGDILKLGSRFRQTLRRCIASSLFSLAKEDLQFFFPQSDSTDALAVGASMLAAENYVANFSPQTD